MLKIIKKDKINFSYIIYFVIVICYIVPFYFISYNYIYFKNIDIFFILIFFSIFTLACSLGIIIVFFAIGAKFRRYAFIFIRFFLFLFIIYGLFLPITDRSEISSYVLNREHVFLGLVICSIVFFLSFKLDRIVFIFTTIILVMNGIYGIVVSFLNISPLPNTEIYNLSKNRNIIVFSIDGLSRDVSLEILQENSHFFNTLKDFTVFSNAVAPAFSTVPSILSELSGIPNLREKFETSSDLLNRINEEELLPNRLKEIGYVVSTYGSYGHKFRDSERVFHDGTLDTDKTTKQKIDDALEIFELSLSRMIYIFTDKLNIKQKVSNIIFYFGVKMSVIGNHATLRELLEHHQGASWDKNSISTILDANKYLENAHVGTDKPVAQFLHFPFAHFPVDFDQNCAYRSYDSSWHASNQNRIGSKNETYCAFTYFSRFINKLKELGVYDKTLIILKSDHGQPIGYAASDKYESFSIKNNELWGFSRLTPFLAIKNFSDDKAQTMFDTRPVILTDLARTLCENILKPTEGCNNYSGYNLLDKDIVIPSVPGIVVLIPKNDGEGFLLDDMVSLKLPRSPDFYENLNDKLTSGLVLSPIQCQLPIKIKNHEPYNNGYTDKSTFVTWRNDLTNYIKFMTPECSYKNIIIKGNGKGVPPGHYDLQVSLMENVNVIDQITVPIQIDQTGEVELNLPIAMFSTHATPKTILTLKLENLKLTHNHIDFHTLLLE